MNECCVVLNIIIVSRHTDHASHEVSLAHDNQLSLPRWQALTPVNSALVSTPYVYTFSYILTYDRRMSTLHEYDMLAQDCGIYTSRKHYGCCITAIVLPKT